MFPDNTYGKISVTAQGTLRVQGAEKEDEGYLVCSALSVAGSTTVRAHLQVKSTLSKYIKHKYICLKIL